jgi:hypothetical protein
MAIDNEPIWEWEQLDQYWSKQGHSDQQWKKSYLGSWRKGSARVLYIYGKPITLQGFNFIWNKLWS